RLVAHLHRPGPGAGRGGLPARAGQRPDARSPGPPRPREPGHLEGSRPGQRPAADRLRRLRQPGRLRGRHQLRGRIVRGGPVRADGGGGEAHRRRSGDLRPGALRPAARPDLPSPVARRAPAGPVAGGPASSGRPGDRPWSAKPVKILLAYRCHDLGRMEFYSRFTPLGLGSINALLRRNGFDARILNASEWSWSRTARFLAAEKPDVFGVSVFTFNRHEAMRLAALARAANPR